MRLTWRALAGVFVVAAVLRLGATVVLQGLDAPPNSDSNPDQVDYEAIAYNLASGGGYSITAGVPTALRAPGTSLTLSPPYVVLGRNYAAIRLWLIALSSATCVLAAILTAICAGPRSGLVAGLWLCVYPGHLYYVTHLLSENVVGFWLVAAAILTIAAMRRNATVPGLVAGFCWGMAILTRVELGILFPFAWAVAVWCRRTLPGGAVKQLAIISVVAAVTVVPWPVRNALALGKPVLSTQRGVVWWGAHNERTFTDATVAGGWIRTAELIDASHRLTGSEVERDQMAWDYGMASYKAHASRLPYLTVMKVFRLLSPMIQTDNRLARWLLASGWILTGPFVLFGLIAAVRVGRGERWPWGVVALPLAAVLLTSAIFYGLPRFRDALSPLFVPFAAWGVIRMAQHAGLISRSGGD